MGLRYTFPALYPSDFVARQFAEEDERKRVAEVVHARQRSEAMGEDILRRMLRRPIPVPEEPLQMNLPFPRALAIDLKRPPT